MHLCQFLDMSAKPMEIESRYEDIEDLRAKNRIKGLLYARAAGFAVGLFLLIWLPFNALRWGGEAPSGLLGAEYVVFSWVGIMLLLPWKRFEANAIWKPLIVVFFLAVGAFAFTMVVDLIFQYILAADQGLKPAPPAFQSLLIFLILMQPPVVIFQRRPELLD